MTGKRNKRIARSKGLLECILYRVPRALKYLFVCSVNILKFALIIVMKKALEK